MEGGSDEILSRTGQISNYHVSLLRLSPRIELHQAGSFATLPWIALHPPPAHTQGPVDRRSVGLFEVSTRRKQAGLVDRLTDSPHAKRVDRRHRPFDTISKGNRRHTGAFSDWRLQTPIFLDKMVAPNCRCAPHPCCRIVEVGVASHILDDWASHTTNPRTKQAISPRRVSPTTSGCCTMIDLAS